MSDSDLLTFAEEEEQDEALKRDHVWKVLIVDDEPDVHHVTKLVLSNTTFLGKSLEFFDCYSAAETREFLSKNDDIAMIFLDVVMEEEDSGLKLVKYIRDELKNNIVRIVLRTGQPGQAPEEKVIVNYDINDYKSKTELTSERLFTSVISSLRSYRDLLTIDRNKRGLEKIIDASANIFEIHSLKQFVSGVLMQILSILHVDDDAVFYNTSGITVTKTGNHLMVMAAAGKFKEQHIEENDVNDVLTDYAKELINRAIDEKKTLIEKNYYVGYFKSNNGSENVIYLEHSEEITEWERDLLEIFCSNIAIAFDNIYLNQELEEAQKEIMFTLGEISESRSRETQNHVKRVGEYCKLMALKSGMSEVEAEELRVSSAMHDIGKLAVPDSVLKKPGPLSEEEYDVIKQHAQAGGDMLKFSNGRLLKKAAVIASQHHERWDGKGYPNGLSGEEIDQCARITSIADVFDALACDRVYRKALPTEKVLEMIKNGKGTQFDPKFVDIIVDNIDEIMKIKVEMSD
jgi:response regulator RpfG family c-di-GMP phosphodiesterase